MMISIVTGGSRGDVQPYIALGKGLKEAGYHTRLIASNDFEGLVTDAGLEFCSTGLSVEQILQSDEWRALTEQGNFLKIVAKMQQESKKQASRMASILPDLLHGTDVMLTGVAGFGGAFTIAQTQRIPIIQAYVFPFTPTREYSSPLTPNLPLGQVLNPLSFHITRQMLWQSSRSGDVETRRLLGLPKGSFMGPFKDLADPNALVLYGYSAHVLPESADWDDTHHVTGYWFLNETSDWTPDAELQDFLDAGDPPVYVGFGSMVNRNPQQVVDTVLEALTISGQRGLLASGWGGMTLPNLPDHIYTIKSVPHSWLFPKMRAVVHHGGAGTTAAGLRAGVPSIIVPFMGDQAFWGKHLHRLGVGTQPIPRKKLSAQRLADAIQEAVSSTEMQQNATQLGHQIQAEGGVTHAVNLIRNHLARQ